MNERVEERLEQLDEAFDQTGAVAEQFQAELRKMQVTMSDAGREVQAMTTVINRGFRSAIDGMVFDGDRLSDALKNIGKSLLDAAYSAAVKPVTSHVSGLVASGLEQMITGGTAFKDGGSFTQGRVQPFARGGVVNGPTYFPMRGGLGLMGEAGPEAIMPLSRGADGSLGVRTQGGGRPVQVTMNVTTPDAGSFARSRTQIAATISRAIERGQRAR